MNPEQEESTGLSVIIRARNEERWIGHSIQSVLDFVDYPEIIVINNNSTDRTLEIAKHFQKDPELVTNRAYTDIKIIDIEKYTPGKAINYGTQQASNDYLMVLSSHCILKKFNFEQHKEDLEKHAAVFGNQTPVWEGKKIKKRYLWSHFINKQVENMFSDMEGRYFFHNAASLFKRETLIDNPFDENLTGKEDRYWANKLISNGSTILYDPIMEVDHHYTDNGNTWKGIG
jgi:rhamnosyltransferase